MSQLIKTNSSAVSSRKRKLKFENDTQEKKRARLCNKVNQPETTINSLPNELLWEIFSCLDRQSLLNASLVNKNWNKIIVRTKLMEKIDQLYISVEKTEDNIPTLTRKYSSVHFSDIVEWNPELMTQLEAIGKDIKFVAFDECFFFENDFINLLQAFPNTQYMEITCCYDGIIPLSSDDSFQFERIEMKSLKTLVLRDCSWPLYFLSTPNLLHFEVETLSIDDQDVLISFLNDQKELQTLHLVDIDELFDSRYGTLEPKFKLNCLKMVYLPFLDLPQTLRFLKQMKSSVTKLDIEELDPHVCEYILSNFNNLASLKIDYDCLPKAKEFYQKMNVNNNLKYLVLYGNMKSCSQLIYFLRKCQRIEELLMSDLHGLHTYYQNFWYIFSALVPNLRTLTVRRINAYNMVFIKLKNLKFFESDCIGHASYNNWIQFCKNNPSIESFHVFSNFKEYFKKVEKVISNSLKNLKDIYFSK